jgi:hypothetical protein
MSDLTDTLLDIARTAGEAARSRAPSPRQLTQDELERLAVRLYHELVALRELANSLPYDDIDRFRLSIRAGEIGAELAGLHKGRA